MWIILGTEELSVLQKGTSGDQKPVIKFVRLNSKR